MNILFDTNVLLDYLLKTIPYEEDARKIVLACKEKEIDGSIAAHSVSNIFYILRKEYSEEERRTILTDICRLFHVEGIDQDKIMKALRNDGFRDFEDCLQMQCAESCSADYIVTRNTDDFAGSSIPCILPKDICIIMDENG